MTRAFVIRPFDKKRDSKGREIDFEDVHGTLIAPALKEAGISGSTTGEIIDAGNVREDMFSLILEADLVVADISIHNANVFYELGIRHGLRRRHTILIRDSASADSPPFDLLTDRYLKYTQGSEESKRELVAMLLATLRADRETDSPVFKMLPSLPEVDLSSVQVLPLDFREEVQRSTGAGSRGWLRLLADDVRGRRFEWAGLELIGQAQWDLSDYGAARDTWERVRENYPNRITANLALANVYERLARDKKLRFEQVAELLTRSDQAIERVLANRSASPNNRVEALTLQGRNQKTRWRLEFAKEPDPARRRSAAMNRSLRDSFAAYRDAFRQDLNHFWSGLAALQMGAIFLALSEGEAWREAFDDDTQAEEYRRKLAQDLASLHSIVAASVDGALLRLPKGDSDRPWAEVSKPDALFLTDAKVERLSAAYRDVIKRQKPFVKDAALGQLRLFADLGVRAAVAEKVIEEIDRQPSAPEAPDAQAQKPPPAPTLAILFVGHRVDAPDRPQPRFPASSTAAAKAAIAAAVENLAAGEEVLGLASAASGGDILFHEVCAETKIRSILCLPFRADLYSAVEFGELDDWRSRFLALQRNEREVRELGELDVLPRWLGGTSDGAWERGNRWVLQMALACGAAKVALLALWDGKSGTRGGTEHMVTLARNAGSVDIKILDPAKLPTQHSP